jgi:hypothetical protein
MNNVADPTNLSQDLQQVLNQLEKFGFKFFGYDENNLPLVIGPNGQVTPLNTAYQFVQKQIQSSKTSSGSVEQIPQATASIEAGTVESGIERKLETVVEKQEFRQEQSAQTASVPQNNTTSSSPKIDVKTTEAFKPFGDGYLPPFDSSDIQNVISFIQNNSGSATSNTSSNKWIAILWKKFLEEKDLQSRNN